ncbi:MAG: Crp/Fnr family transcriptional regulator [Caulobacter sp.]|nr:Crp/Fnr family transcriptional regulator [Caulobacter sp.]
MSRQLHYGMIDAALDPVAAIPWFARQPAERRNALLEAGRLSRRGAGEWMHGEGDEETGVLAVVTGALKVYGQAPGGREALIGLLPAGTVIGQSAAFGGGPRIVTAITASPSLVFTLSDSALRRVAAAHPGLWEALSALVYGQLRLNAQAVAELIALKPRERLVSRLLQMAAQAGGEIAVSQADLAEMIGVTRKAVNGWLGKLEAAGLVERGYGVIRVLDAARLERMLAQ